MIIKISNLSEGVHKYKFDEMVNEIGLDDPFFGNILLDVQLDKAYNQIILNAEVIVNTAFCCDRCASNYNMVLKTEYKMVYLFGVPPEENEAIDITYLRVDADKIDLRKDVHDYLILAIPMKKLCKENCKGLCYSCGKDLNVEDCECMTETIDQRWKPLLEIKKN